MSVKDITTTETEAREQQQPLPVKTGKRKTCMRHCKRFWWAYLIAFICIVVLVVCLIIFVAVPKIAQDKVNGSELDIQGVHILETESDGYRMEINSTVKSDGKVKAKVSAFTGTMYLEDHPDRPAFATLEFPQTTSDKHQEVNISQAVTISDMEAFTIFNIWFTNNETLRIGVEGKTKVEPNGLARKYDVDFKKSMEIKGLHLFDGTVVPEGRLAIPPEDGKNFFGVAEIPNASHFTLDVGNVSFINYIDDERVGELFIDNLLLVPGINRVNISAHIDQTAVIRHVRGPEYCETGIVPMKLLGENVTNHGENLTYFAAGLGSNNQTVEIDIGKILANDLDYEVTCSSSSSDD